MEAFSLWLDLAKEVNRHFLENDYCCFELSSKFLYVNKYWPILRVEKKIIVRNVNLTSNRDYNHGAIIRIYME